MIIAPLLIGLAISSAQAGVVHHSAKYKECKKSCRAARDTAGAECKKKPISDQQACQNVVKANANKCKRACTE